MTSQRQLVANRANALRSTGPRSIVGKNRSSQNAVKHGLTANKALLPGENPEEYRGLRNAIFSSLDPQGAFESQLVERAFSLMWRLRRVETFEVALFQWLAHYEAEIYDALDNEEAQALRNDTHAFPPEPNLNDGLTIGRMFETLLGQDLAGKLSRYETSMQRSLASTLAELRELQRPRKEFAKEVEKEKVRLQAERELIDPEDDPEYWARVDMERIRSGRPP